MATTIRSGFYILESAVGGGYLKEDGTTTANISFAKHFENTTEIDAFKEKFPFGVISKYVSATYNVVAM